MPKKGYSENGEMKRCRGPLHREGVMLPISHFSVIKSGPRKGKHLPACKRCRTYYSGRTPDQRWVPNSQVQPYVDFLVQKLGSQQRVIERLGKHRGFLSRRRENWRYGSFLEIKELAAQVEKETSEIRLVKSSNSEAEVVECHYIASEMQRWAEIWEREYPKEALIADPNSIHYTPYTWLEEKTGIHRRALFDIFNEKVSYVSLSKADALLTAIHKNHLLMRGEIPIIKNPRWSLETYMEYMSERGCI